MITEALQHCTGIGPVRLAQLHAAGLRSWSDILDSELVQSYRWQAQLVEEARQCAEALEREDVRFFVNRLAPQDKWRILAHYFDRTTFFDIETTGLDFDATITVIICWHKGELRTFVEHENLDDFLDLLDEVTLLASFNGSSFDVPRVLQAFHLPDLPCPHLDVRWIAYHQGHRGTLETIGQTMRIDRPVEIHSMDGQDAVRLWLDWRSKRDKAARDLLINYCAADVLQLAAVAARLAGCNVQINMQDALASHTCAVSSAANTANSIHAGNAMEQPHSLHRSLTQLRAKGKILARFRRQTG